MNAQAIAGIALMCFAATVSAQRPLTYPLRGQSPGAQGVDEAYCYGQANTKTGVDMARQPQRPTRREPIVFAADAGRGASEPPLPTPPERKSATPSAPHAPTAAASASAAAIGASPAPSAGSGATMPPITNDTRASETKLPPVPPPEPPMTTYWRAYGDCMQGRGYGVR
ncbi:hypothetical protein [Trinickia fusca]|uniref:Uncharacterized protein n=1 Tax=Trinickia fusca TaxID=2419777 RepID=A0A494X1N5_9BURK|nr:hypothetical protein [Trinickia fusca]RKP44627.1 hypothetical protein D7S89_22425 [Trinickia fusca]